MVSTYLSKLLSFCNPLLKERTVFAFLSLLVDWAALHWTRLGTLITKYDLLDTLQGFRRAPPVCFGVCFGVLMTRRTRLRALCGGSTTGFQRGLDWGPHFCSLDGYSVLSCGRGSGQGQVVKRGQKGDTQLMSYLENPLSPAAKYRF